MNRHRKKPKLAWFRFWKRVAANWTDLTFHPIGGKKIVVEFCDN